MTVFESLQAWLMEILNNTANGFPGQYYIDAEFLPENKIGPYEPVAVMASPNDTAVSLMGGQVRHTASKTVYIRRPFIDTENRTANEAFMERLRACIFIKNQKSDLPLDGRKWRSIEYTGGSYPSSIGADKAVYQVTLKIVYEEFG